MDHIGKYKVLGELGRGGFGAVYLCEDNLQQKVAVKVFDPKDDVVAGMATSATSDAGEVLKQRFQAEAMTLRKLSSNPYIVDLYDFDQTEDGIAYYVMPYLAHSLVDDIGKDAFSAGALEELDPELRPRRVSVALTLRVLTEILEGMKTVHREGLVHRDLKPANILFDQSGPEGKVQVCDFGIAKLPDAEHSQSGVGMGSRNYMSPEQRESAKHVDATSDVYAIGVMAYRMLTGTLPGGRFEDPIKIAPTIGQPLNDLILAAISYDVTERPKDASDFLSKLKAAISTMDDAAPVDEGTGTWVEQGESSLRDELKPLRDQIEKLLLANGEIKVEDRAILDALAHIVDLDASGVEALITSVEETLRPQLRPIQNFLSLVDKQLAEGDIKIEALYFAGDAIGWDQAKVDAVISARSPKSNSGEPAQQNPPAPEADKLPVPDKPGPKATGAPDKPGSGRWVVMVIVLLLLAGGGWWYYDQQQQQAAQERVVAERRAEITRQETAAWATADGTNTIAAYETYQSESFATVAHKEEASRRIDILTLAAADRSEQIRLSNLAVKKKAAEEKAERDGLARLAKIAAEKKAAEDKAESARLAAAKKAAEDKAKQVARSQPGQTFKDCDVCPAMVVIPAGSFRMGSNEQKDEQPIHTVRISQPFALGKTEVTFAEYDAFAKSTGRSLPEDRGWGRGKRPVINVNWDDATAYAKWLSSKTGKRYRLPSESEWESAARAGSTTKYYFGDSEASLCRYGNHADTSTNYNWRNESCSDGVGKQTASVGRYEANAFGLYDMYGNVFEWTGDCMNESYSGAPANGGAWTSGDCSLRILRGGSWNSFAVSLRSAKRGYQTASDGLYSIGFRLAQDL